MEMNGSRKDRHSRDFYNRSIRFTNRTKVEWKFSRDKIHVFE